MLANNWITKYIGNQPTTEEATSKMPCNLRA
jgi:hypothetical protein